MAWRAYKMAAAVQAKSFAIFERGDGADIKASAASPPLGSPVSQSPPASPAGISLLPSLFISGYEFDEFS
jgi:hypothetical protein